MIAGKSITFEIFHEDLWKYLCELQEKSANIVRQLFEIKKVDNLTGIVSVYQSAKTRKISINLAGLIKKDDEVFDFLLEMQREGNPIQGRFVIPEIGSYSGDFKIENVSVKGAIEAEISFTASLVISGVCVFAQFGISGASFSDMTKFDDGLGFSEEI